MNKSRVLIVDDEADIRELLSLTLQRMGLDTDAPRASRGDGAGCKGMATICA